MDQYQQQPVPLEGNLIRRDWFMRYDNIPASHHRRIVMSWDISTTTGNTSDYSVCTVWEIDGRNYYLRHVFRQRLAYPDLRRKIVAMAQEFAATTLLIEDAGPGSNLLEDLRCDPSLCIPGPIGIKPEGSKIDRMAAQSARIEAGQVHIPNDAPWLAVFLNEMLAFPGGKHDDQVDSVSQFVLWAQRSTQYQDVQLGMPIQVGQTALWR